MVAVMPKADEKKFKKFLESEILKQPLTYFHQFRGGKCSYSFFVKTKDDFWVVKILLNKYITSDVHHYLETQIPLCPQLKGIKMDKIFTYDNQTVTMQRYYGKVLPPQTLDLQIMTKVLAVYKVIAERLSSYPVKEEEFVPDCLVEQYHRLDNEIRAKKSLRAKILGHLLHQISPQALIYDKTKFTYIHGDFHNNQILFEDEHISAVIDWDNLCTGYKTEDYWRLFFYNVQYIYNPIVLSYCSRKLFSHILSLTDASKEEWLLTLQRFLLLKIDGNFHKKFGLRRFIRLLYCYFLVKQATKMIYSLQKAGC